MKKKVLLGMAAFTMWFATSCQNELDVISSSETSAVSFKVETPEIKSRAFSDGATATVLQYAVYNSKGEELTDLTVTDGKINGSTTVELQLTTGNSYSVIFWAGAEGAPYTVDFANKKMSVDYTAAKTLSNDEKRDAFYKYHEFTVKGAQTETIELKRPFAQLNIGTADFAASTSAGYTPTHSSVKVSNVYTTLNLVDGTVSNPSTEDNTVTFASAAIPAAYDETAKTGEKFPVTGYDYLAMNYLLVAAEKEVVDIEYTYGLSADDTDAKTRIVGSVPVQRNYRTNIYGKLLTSQVDINVEINPDYNEPDYNLNPVTVDGVSYSNFAEAVAKAIELGMPVEFIDDVKLAENEVVTVKKDESLTLNLNGFSLTGTDNTTKNFGLITNNGTLVVNGPGLIGLVAKQNSGWNRYSAVIANNPGGNLTVQNGAIIEHFGGTDMAYGIDNLTNGKGTSAITTVDGATVKSTYSAVRQFLNGIEATNELYVKSGSVLESTNRSIFFHDPSKQANTGKLVVEDGAKLQGDVRLSVTAGSTEWPVEVSVADAALVGESEVTWSNVPAGYLVIEKDGIWTVVEGAVSVATAEELSSAIKNAENVKDIYFANDITVDQWIMFSETKTIGNGKIITVKMDGLTINGNGHTLTVNSIESASNGNHLFDNASNLNISNLTIKNADGVAGGAISLKSGNISKVNFVGVSTAIYPGDGEINVDECTFATKATALYFEQERDNLTVTNCTFTQPDNVNVILLRGDVKFTDNIVNSGRTVNIVSGSPVVTGNNFNNVRLKVYSAATATVSGNTINNLEFETTTYSSTFADNTMSEEAQAALDAATKN